MVTAIELSTLGHRIRHRRVSSGYTLDELGERVGIAGSQLSLIENGKREPKLSVLQAIATATGVEVTDLLSNEPPNRRAALEIELERAQAGSVFRRLGVAPVKVSKGMPDETIESILGLHREPFLARILRRSLGNRPAHQHPVPFQAEVVVEPARVMLLNHEDEFPLLRALHLPAWLLG